MDDHLGFSQTSSRRAELLEEFPTELWIEVIASLEPRDVVLLSSTCRHLRCTLNQTSVWVSVLRFLCCREGLFEPSYSFDTMDLGALQRASLGPHRWNRVIQKHHANDTDKSPNFTELEPISTTKITDASQVGSQTNQTTRLVLVPGGRFLLATEEGSLQLWDLCSVGATHRKGPNLISKHTLKMGSPITGHDLVVHIVDQRKLRVGVATFGKEIVVRIFDICPADHDAVFVTLASVVIKIPGWTSCRLQLRSMCVYIQTSDGGILWDFVLGNYALMPHYASVMLGFTGAFIALIQNHSMDLWSVPLKAEYVRPVPLGLIAFPKGVKGFEPPIPPDLVVELSPSAPSDDERSVSLSPGLDPCSFVFEAGIPRLLYIGILQPPPITLLRQHRVVITQDLSDRHQMRAEIQHLTPSVLPEHYPYFIPFPTISRFLAQGPRTCMLGIGFRAVSAHYDLCLRTITTENCKPPSKANVASTKEGDVSVITPTAAVTMTAVIRGQDINMDMGGFGGLCCASGRLVFKKRDSPDEGNLYFRDYLT